jgi:zinc/manganese transport system substrate-binding protein
MHLRWSRRALGMVTALSLVAILGAAQAAEPLRVVATFSVLGDLVKEVGGDRVAVTVLVRPGSDAHVYEPTPADARALAATDLVVVNGLGMEGWMTRLIDASGTKARIAVASQGVQPQTMREEEEGEAAAAVADPHAWQNIANGEIYVRNIAAALAAADPADATAYQDRAAAYLKQLRDLDGWVRGQIGTVPAAKRRIITSHDAFGYFGRAYGLTFLAPVGISTDAEPTAAGLAGLITQIEQEGVKALFVESMTSPRLVEQLAHDAGAVVGGTLYSDSLSEPGGPADTYIKMFQHNVPAMVAAMQKN